MTNKISFSCIVLALAVIIGAFGAHALKPFFEQNGEQTYKLASQYHFIHGIGLLILALIAKAFKKTGINKPFLVMTIGVTLFSGSLYLLAFKNFLSPLLITILGPLTPIGGLCLIVAWIWAALLLRST